jgi:hypothetical protein
MVCLAHWEPRSPHLMQALMQALPFQLRNVQQGHKPSRPSGNQTARPRLWAWRGGAIVCHPVLCACVKLLSLMRPATTLGIPLTIPLHPSGSCVECDSEGCAVVCLSAARIQGLPHTRHPHMPPKHRAPPPTRRPLPPSPHVCHTHAFCSRARSEVGDPRCGSGGWCRPSHTFWFCVASTWDD